MTMNEGEALPEDQQGALCLLAFTILLLGTYHHCSTPHCLTLSIYLQLQFLDMTGCHTLFAYRSCALVPFYLKECKVRARKQILPECGTFQKAEDLEPFQYVAAQ